MTRYAQVVEDATGSPFRPGNSFKILQNGDEIFPSMLQAIRGARHSVEFLSFVFWRSDIGTEFADALSERARDGVKVRVLIDAVGGASLDTRTIWRLERAGVKVGWFRPGHPRYLSRLNNRTHRKILIVDGHTGFTGGVGIADQWTGGGQDLTHWRETHCRVQGPAVADMHTGFVESWAESTREILRPYQPAPRHGDVAVHTTVSTAGYRPTRMERLVRAVIPAAEARLWVTSAYFVPTPRLSRLLIEAAGRGVDVRVLTNGGTTNHYVTMLAGRATFGHLLAAGVKIYEYQKTLHHAKVITADQSWATVGSTNLDARSLILDDELNVSVVDHDLVAALDDQFLTDLEYSEQIEAAFWRSRSRWSQLTERASALFADQL